jgi:hypothetical protein
MVERKSLSWTRAGWSEVDRWSRAISGCVCKLLTMSEEECCILKIEIKLVEFEIGVDCTKHPIYVAVSAE